VHGELSRTLGVRAEPADVFVRRWPSAIPQYNRGHTGLRRAVEAWSGRRPVSVIGAALTGASLNACATAGRAEADRLAALLSRTRTRGEAACLPA
jgi:oxygen-dependent protoporphyrinogen oxidase